MFFAAVIVGGLALSSICFGYSGGSGTPAAPYQIATKADLLALAVTTADYNKCLILTADINMGGEVFTKAIIAADTNSSAGFQGTAFTGAFDGNGHKITNFTINGGDYLGLFGQTNSGGSVKNLGLENFSVSGPSSYVGGLVGWNYGNISNCFSTGAVTGGDYSEYLGGLVGYNYGGDVTNCYSTGTVSGGSLVGGLVGWNDGSISNCYSKGDVAGGDYSYYLGGLVGWNNGSISNCYSTGAVGGSNSEAVGGLVGMNWGTLTACYATGSVNGVDQVGGLVGENNSGSISSSFWDTQTSGQTTSAGGTGKTTAEMKTLSTFTSAGWDFVEIWGIEENQTYPFLRKYLTSDLNYDGGVDFVDFAIFAQNWLEM
jgi:hypothetical protein